MTSVSNTKRRFKIPKINHLHEKITGNDFPLAFKSQWTLKSQHDGIEKWSSGKYNITIVSDPYTSTSDYSESESEIEEEEVLDKNDVTNSHDFKGEHTTPQDDLDSRLSRIHKIIHSSKSTKNEAIGDFSLNRDVSAGVPEQSSREFINAEIPDFNKSKAAATNSIKLNSISLPFEFGDRGHVWRQMKFNSFLGSLSNRKALEGVLHEKYPKNFKYSSFIDKDKCAVLNQYATLWDVGYILLESKWLNNREAYQAQKENFERLRFIG